MAYHYYHYTFLFSLFLLEKNNLFLGGLVSYSILHLFPRGHVILSFHLSFFDSKLYHISFCFSLQKKNNK